MKRVALTTGIAVIAIAITATGFFLIFSGIAVTMLATYWSLLLLP